MDCREDDNHVFRLAADQTDDRINEAVSKFRTTTAFGSHVRPRLALVGPRRSGKTTMAYLAVKALVFDYVAAETWDSTFVFVVNWARLLAHASSETATFYTRFVALAIRQLKAQRPSLVCLRLVVACMQWNNRATCRVQATWFPASPQSHNPHLPCPPSPFPPLLCDPPHSYFLHLPRTCCRRRRCRTWRHTSAG